MTAPQQEKLLLRHSSNSTLHSLRDDPQSSDVHVATTPHGGEEGVGTHLDHRPRETIYKIVLADCLNVSRIVEHFCAVTGGRWLYALPHHRLGQCLLDATRRTEIAVSSKCCAAGSLRISRLLRGSADACRLKSQAPGFTTRVRSLKLSFEAVIPVTTVVVRVRLTSFF